MAEVLFLDFDGVIADSIDETYLVSRNVYYGFFHGYDESLVKCLFYRHRGLVGPVHQYLSLHRAIEISQSDSSSIEQVFFQQNKAIAPTEKQAFEERFFSLRERYQKDVERWVAMNPLTEFGKKLVGRAHSNCVIVTTKNIKSVEILLSHNHINVKEILGREHYNSAGNKGKLISAYLDAHSEYDRGVFVDDHSGHLDAACADSRVLCMFAEWGYGTNTNYDVFSPAVWETYL